MAINVLTPIETKYKGILFRSRIEARWALFYDKIKVPYEYEREGYKLDASTYYLPDFWMPVQDCFIEIKGEKPTLEEEAKASILAQQSGKRVFIFFGSIPAIEQYGLMNFDPDTAGWVYVPLFNDPYWGWDHGQLWCECHMCGSFGIEYEGRDGRIMCCEKMGKEGHVNPASNKLVYAYNAARSARF